MQLKGNGGHTGAMSLGVRPNRRNIVACILSKKYDYVGVAITPWHARMAVASYLKLRADHLVNSGIILIDRHNKDGYLVLPEVSAPGLSVAYLERSAGGWVSMVQAFVCRLALPSLQSKKESGHLVYVANPSFPGSIFDSFSALKLDCRLSYILLDEGVGSYLSTSEDWAKQSIRDRGLHGLSALIRNWLFNYEQRKLPEFISELEEKKRYELFYLFESDGKLNNTNAAFVKQSFELNAKSASFLVGSCNDKYKNSVVFCSQYPLVEAGSISLSAHCCAVDAAYQVSKRLGAPLVIKLHPRESDLEIYDGLDAFIDSRRGVALEDILGYLDKPPLCIASLCSTAMITASAVFGCSGISLNALIPDAEASDSFGLFCRRMDSLFGDYYKTPESIDEFCLFIKRAH